LIKQVITVNHKKFATGLFWQPLGVGNTAKNYAKELSKNGDRKYTLYIGYKSMVGLTDTHEGAVPGMSSAAVEVVSSLADLVSFLGVFQANSYYYLVAVRNGVIIRDVLLNDAESARRLYTQLAEIPDWGALFAPASWGIPKSQERLLSDLIGRRGASIKLRQIDTSKSLIPAIFFLILFVIFGYIVLKNSVPNQNVDGPKISQEKITEYKKQLELKTQQIADKILPVAPVEQKVDYAYNHLPDLIERADLCYRAIAFVMQPITGWNQTFAKCDEEFVTANFSRDFGTLNDFYEIGGDLMPGATVQQMSEDEIIVRVKLPDLETGSSIDERDQTTLMRDITTVFQQANINADIHGVVDKVVNGATTENIYVTEVGVSSKLIPTEFMRAFDGFEGVYMPMVTWRANTRMWNYEVVIYSK
jgi:hypothetical protein